MSKERIEQLTEELKLVKKKLRISEQDVFRLAAEKIDLQNTIKELLNQNKTKMTFVDYIIKERSRKFLSISLMDMEKSNYKGTLEEWFSDMYTEYKIINQNKNK